MNRLQIARAALKRKSPTPLGALARGLIAGAAGAAAQSLFFSATRRWAPEPSKVPPGQGKPERQARKESNLETVARRTVQDLMKRGPLDAARKQRAASAVHYFFGAVWGGLYGLWRESFRTSPFLFGVGVWMASDNLLLPAFRVAAWPRHYSMAEHRYALAAHAVYGLATAGCYALLRDLGPVPLRTVPPLLALQASAWMLRTPPMRLLARRQPPHRRLLRSALVRKVALA
jgi:hypothetical protein